jgi:hypothetical protein
MKVVCPQCGQPVAGADIDLQHRQALCRPGGELFELEAPMQQALAVVRPAPIARQAFRPAQLRWSEQQSDGQLQAVVAPGQPAAICSSA